MTSTLLMSKSGTVASAGAQEPNRARFTRDFRTAALNVILAGGAIAVAAAVALAMIGTLASML